MKEKLKDIWIDIVLIIGILFLLLVIHTVFIAGPIRVMEHEDNLYVEAYEGKHQLKDLELCNRFSLSKTYYIAKDAKHLYYFDENIKEEGKRDYKALDEAHVVAQDLGFKEKHLKYGVYDKTIVYALEKKDHIIFLDMDDLKIVFEFGG